MDASSLEFRKCAQVLLTKPPKPMNVLQDVQLKLCFHKDWMQHETQDDCANFGRCSCDICRHRLFPHPA
ncbi:hypothetical protein BN126350183 [Stenotrophomonas thermophila]|nr:hypothetical protein BN126350183 [Stenotrophomonas maltophilia]